MRHQPRLKQSRYPITSLSISKICDAVERDAIRWNCSKSWIIATALGAFYGINVIKPQEAKRKVKGSRVFINPKDTRVLIDLKRFKRRA